MAKTIAEINAKIRANKAVVVTAEEMIQVVKADGVAGAAKKVDVVTTGTFGPMCSSSMYLNVGHTRPRIKLGGGHATLNGVAAYTGIAAVDIILGATALREDDPLNSVYPGAFKYGGGHVIEELVAGADIDLAATAYGTDCYPRKMLRTVINIKDVNEAVLFNQRNAYQNYNCAVNLSDRIIYTYLGILQPRMGNANYCSAGQLSPLINDPYYLTIGIGTRIFLGGGEGYIAWNGTQHNPNAARNEFGVPRAGAATLALIGDLKTMSPQFLRGASFRGYGCSLAVGIGIPIPILNEDICRHTAISDADITAPVIDYSNAYPNAKPGPVCEVTYAELRSGHINVNGKSVPTAAISSYPKAVEIAETLKSWIESGRFTLAEPVQPLPGAGSDHAIRMLKERSA